MAVKLHRCFATFAKSKSHPCWKVQSALDEAGIDYEVVKVPLIPGRRKQVIAATGQKHVPAIELENGSWYRKQSGEMADEIRSGRFSPTGPA
jgi:glutathione S-transferase